MACHLYPDGRHRLTRCDDPQCCPKGYVEVCLCGAVLGNKGRYRRRRAKEVAAWLRQLDQQRQARERTQQ